MMQRDGRTFFGMPPMAWGLCLLVVLGLVWFGLGSDALAQTESAPPPSGNVEAAPQAVGATKLIELFMDSIAISGPIAVLSILAVMLFLYFLVTINAHALAPSSFIDDVNKLVESDRYEEAASFCRAHRRVFIATILQRCVENAGKNHSVIMEMLDSEGRRRADILWNRISYLADISNVSPMLGLLGTVWGMMQAFFPLAQSTGSINAQALSGAIGVAMATTFFGLIVGILSLVFYSITKARATRALANAEQAVHSVADRIKRGGE